MTTATGRLVRAFTLVALGLGLGMGVSAGCEKKTSSPDDGAKNDGAKKDGEKKDGNLCTAYTTCDECIAGEEAKGEAKGEAETECGAAAAGCWTTWKKPIVCHGKEKKKEG